MTCLANKLVWAVTSVAASAAAWAQAPADAAQALEPVLGRLPPPAT